MPVEFSSWTVQGILAHAIQGAMRLERPVVSTADLLYVAVRRSAADVPALRRWPTKPPASVRWAGDDLPPDGPPVGTDDLTEAVAVLREVSWSVRRDGRARRSASAAPPPRWSPGVGHALATALQMAGASGRSTADQRETLVALVRHGGTAARELIGSVGADVDALVAAIDALPARDRASIWAPALDHLEMLGIVPTSTLVRLLTAPLRAMSSRVDGAHYRHLATLEEEATRQAVRAGRDEVTLQHVVLAMAAVGHQIAVSGAGQPTQAWAPSGLLAAGGLTYAAIRHTGFVATPAGIAGATRDGLAADILTPAQSAEVTAYLETVRTEGQLPTGGGALLVDVLLNRTPGGGAAIEALGGDAEAIRVRLSTGFDRA
jgi:hypothetical protein